MILGYNTNGFAHHRIEDTLTILAELGYKSVALTLDYGVLNPFEPDLLGRTAEIRTLLERYRLRCVIETGARFLLDPRRKHQPTLLSPSADDRETRSDFLKQSINIAKQLDADAVSFWSGAAVDVAPAHELKERLLSGCFDLCDYAESQQVRLAFEPEPGMFIDTMAKFAELHRQIARPIFGLTMDVGHLHCQDEGPIADHLRQWKDALFNIHIEDMRKGVHDHLMFGEGEMDFTSTLSALHEIHYTGGVHVELSRHSYDAVNTARKAISFLRPFLVDGG